MDATVNQSSNLDFLGAASALGLCIMFGSNAIAVKITFTGFGIYFIAGLRFMVASFCLVIWANMTGQQLLVPRKKWLPISIISVAFAIQLLLIYAGLNKTTVARSALITNLQPFFVLFLAHFFIPGDRINLNKTLGIILAFTGMVFVFLDHTVLSRDLRTGDLLTLAGAFGWACNAVYTKRVIKDYKPIQIAVYPMIAAIPIAFLTSLFLDDELVRFVNSGILLAFFYQCFVAAFGYVVWNSLLAKYGAVTLHSFIFVMPISGVFLSNIILDEPVTQRLLTGLAFVVTGLLVTHLKGKKLIRPIFNMSRNV